MAPQTRKQTRGTVTVLFTDAVGSTELLDRLGDDAADHLRRKHFRRLRQVVRSFKGHEVKSMGDGLMVVFTSASDAAACAVAIQQSSNHDDEAFQVRVGLHSGEPTWDNQDLFGTPVVVAKRLCDKAAGGQIVVSDLVRALIGRRGGFTFRELGFLELKGFQAPVAAAEVMWGSTRPLSSTRRPAKSPPSCAEAVRCLGGSRPSSWQPARSSLVLNSLETGMVGRRGNESSGMPPMAIQT